MQKTELTKLARDAGITFDRVHPHQLFKFAELVSQKEREQYIKLTSEVEGILRLTLSKLSKTLLEHERSLSASD